MSHDAHSQQYISQFGACSNFAYIATDRIAAPPAHASRCSSCTLQFANAKGWRALFTGLKPAVVATTASSGIYFTCYSMLRQAAVVSTRLLGHAARCCLRRITLQTSPMQSGSVMTWDDGHECRWHSFIRIARPERLSPPGRCLRCGLTVQCSCLPMPLRVRQAQQAVRQGRRSLPTDSKAEGISVGASIVIAAVAGWINVLLTNPIWVIHTQMQASAHVCVCELCIAAMLLH